MRQIVNSVVLLSILTCSCLAQSDLSFDRDSLYEFGDSLYQWKFKNQEEFTTISGQGLLIAHFYCHIDYNLSGLVLIFAVGPSENKLIFEKKTEMGDSNFAKLKFFNTIPQGDSVPQQFFYLNDQQLGTGTYKLEWIYHISANNVVCEVPLRPNPTIAKLKLNSGEKKSKPGFIVARDDTLYHVSYIWNDGDGNCCPNAGRVTGTMRIYRDPDNPGRFYRQFINMERVPYSHPVDQTKYHDW